MFILRQICALGFMTAAVVAAPTYGALISDGFSYADQAAFEGTAPTSNGMSTGGAYSNQYTSNNKWNLSTTGGISNSGRISPSGGQNTLAVNNDSFAGFGTHSNIGLSVKTFITSRATVDSTAGSAFRGVLKTDATTSESNSLNFTFNYAYNAAETGTGMKFTLASNGSTLDTLSGFSTTGKWYRWDANWTLVNSAFNFSLKMYDLGSDGLQTATEVGSWARTGISQNTVRDASTLYAALGGKYRSSIGTARIDDLQVVPEPSVLSLLGLAALPMLRRRRV